MLLSDILSLLPGVYAEHEPLPDVSKVWWRLRDNPALARRWLVQSKLRAILKSLQSTKSSVYVETSHMLCKGFFEPLLDMGITFDLILLSRDLHDTAMSLHSLQDIPMRSKMGRRWLPSPSDSTNISVLPKPYEQWSDYQLVYWYVLEMELRKIRYWRLWKSMGGTVAETSIYSLKTKAGLDMFLHAMNLPSMPDSGWRDYQSLCLVKRNAKSSSKAFYRAKGLVKPYDVEIQELTVRRGINYDDVWESLR